MGTASVLGSVDQTVINASGGASGPYEGAYVTGWYPAVNDPAWDAMKKVIKEQSFGDNDVDAADAGVQTTWIAYTVLKAAVESLGDGEVSAATLTRALDDGLKIDTGGLTPPLQWEFADKLASVGFPRLVNAEVTLQVVRQGRLVSARDDAVDTTRTLQNARRGLNEPAARAARRGQPPGGSQLGRPAFRQAVLLAMGFQSLAASVSPCSPCRCPGCRPGCGWWCGPCPSCSPSCRPSGRPRPRSGCRPTRRPATPW